MASYEQWNEARAEAIIAAHRGMEGAALPILHALQAVFGCVPTGRGAAGRRSAEPHPGRNAWDRHLLS